jgi:hypothetical protein
MPLPHVFLEAPRAHPVGKGGVTDITDAFISGLNPLKRGL